MNPTKGSSICTEYPTSSFLLRSKPNNPDSVQKSIEPQVCLQPFTHNSVGGQGSPLSSKDTKSVLIQEQLKGQLGLIARERSETAFILPSKKADCEQRKQIVGHLVTGVLQDLPVGRNHLIRRVK